MLCGMTGLVSRQAHDVRADFAMDMWSIACTVYELFSGTILFQGRDNNEMLRLIMELKGKFSNKMVKKGMFAHLHFAGAPLCIRVLVFQYQRASAWVCQSQYVY